MNKQESKEVFYAVGGGLLASFLVYSIGRLLIKRQQALQSPIQSAQQQPVIPQQPPSREELIPDINSLLRILESGTADELKSISIPGRVDLSQLSVNDRKYLWYRLKYTTDRAYYTGPRQEPYPTNDTGIALLITRNADGNIGFSPIFYDEQSLETSYAP